ncbi:P52 family lipoprotein [Borreliella afzelii]|uniref:Uncharacterized protein n=1 Tax=Borreliella afzelii TaxID=29518 RepID=A0AB34Z4Q6_BORAF|nr:hypothetical protein [Borreliella afzelii]
MKNGTREIPPLSDYNEEYFNKFFLSLSSDRSKELIKLFSRVKNERNDRFKHAVYWLYLCIRDLYSSDIKYFSCGKNVYTNDFVRLGPTIASFTIKW